MSRKRLTEVFPQLAPLRRKEKTYFFYWKMKHDSNVYSKIQQQDDLPVELFKTACPMYNHDTGFDMKYQENKVFNLKLAAAKLDGLLIRPYETFSFFKTIKGADEETPYKDGLTVINGKLTTAPGGGMCQLSNLLFWAFLHTPLNVTERHGHAVKDFPEPDSDAVKGVDATVAECWLDLKARNDSSDVYQIRIEFTDTDIICRILCSSDEGYRYGVANCNLNYVSENHRIYEQVDVLQTRYLNGHPENAYRRVLYRNTCEIGYPLPEGTAVMQGGLL